ncbi:MAG: hypothetical protein ABIS47_04290 [Acidimicrobiales bacterium]
MLPIVARQCSRTLEPVPGLVYFAPEVEDCFDVLGLSARAGYFAGRAAPMGAVAAEVVVATFYSFSPHLVHQAMDGVWATAGPAELIAARQAGVDVALHRILGPAVRGAEVDEAAGLARAAAEAAPTPGRPLAAGVASLAWPDEPHLVLWQAVTRLREHRGDGHVACLVEAGVGPLESLVLHVATGEISLRFLQSTRGWSPEAWQTAAASLVDRGLLATGGELTDEGRARRQDIEGRTDELALAPWLHLGEEGCTRLRALVRPWSRAVVEAGGRAFWA